MALPDTRRGILGHGSILVLTSNADRTSPVYRGKWVMEVLLGSPPPPPPPNVPELDEVKPTASGRTLSVRERMEEHRKNPTCNSCHRVIDPLGLALENYDPTGAWRIKDNEVAVDPVGVLYDGTKVEGPASLRSALLRHKDAVVLSFTESLMTYALGRRVESFDMPADSRHRARRRAERLPPVGVHPRRGRAARRSSAAGCRRPTRARRTWRGGSMGRTPVRVTCRKTRRTEAR